MFIRSSLISVFYVRVCIFLSSLAVAWCWANLCEVGSEVLFLSLEGREELVVGKQTSF